MIEHVWIFNNRKGVSKRIFHAFAPALLLLAVLSSVPAWSSADEKAGTSPPGTVTMTLDDCIETSLSNNPGIEIKKLDLVSDERGIVVEDSAFDPSFTADFSYSDSNTVMGPLRNVGLRTGDPDGFETFGEFVDAYIEQAKFTIKKIVDATTIRDRLYAEKLPAPHISAFTGGCIEKRKDVTRGGAGYDLEGILFMTSIANTVDSLFVIKKLIFDEKALTFRRLLEAIDNNYRGYEGVLNSNIAGKK